MKIFVMCLLLISCAHGEDEKGLFGWGRRRKKPRCEPPPPISLNIYVGDPESGSVVNEKNEKVSCIEEKFVDFACLHVDSLVELKKRLDKCEGRKND